MRNEVLDRPMTADDDILAQATKALNDGLPLDELSFTLNETSAGELEKDTLRVRRALLYL